MDPITVSALNHYVKILLESNERLQEVSVTGEISGLSINSISRHMYFVLKDSTAAIKVACFKSNAEKLRFVPKDGMQITVSGKVSIFERDGQYQLIASNISPVGEGEINKYLEALKAKLSKEGLFDESRKLRLRRFPKVIAVVSAKGSAALADILTVTARRYPLVKIIIFPVYVQGVQAEDSIVEAIEEINQLDEIDTVIVARGGGSKEDLFVFNSEAIARAVSKLKYPLISAVGHQTDVTIIDMVADVRAATPSAAAEIAVPDIEAILASIYSSRRYIARAIDRNVENAKFRIEDAYLNVSRQIDRRFTNYNEYIVDEYELTKQAVETKIAKERTRVVDFKKALGALSPLNVLERGYIYTEKDDKQVSSIDELVLGEELTLVFKDGYVTVTVKEIERRD